MFKPKNSAEKKALEEKIRKIKRDMDLVRPPDTAVEVSPDWMALRLTLPL